MPERQRPWVVADAAKLECDVATVEALARLALDARRLGCALRIESCSPELRELIAFLGLEHELVGPSGTISGTTTNEDVRRDSRSRTSPTSTDEGVEAKSRRM